MAEHYLDDSVVHAFWDNSYPPRVEIEPGDTVVFECREAVDGQVTPDSGHDALDDLDFSRIHPLTGPVFVKGATGPTEESLRQDVEGLLVSPPICGGQCPGKGRVPVLACRARSTVRMNRRAKLVLLLVGLVVALFVGLSLILESDEDAIKRVTNSCRIAFLGNDAAEIRSRARSFSADR